MKKVLSLLLVLFAGIWSPAEAVSPGALVSVIFGGANPLVQANFAVSGSLPSWLSHSRAGGAMMFDSTGKLTYAPNNVLTYSNTFTNATWTKQSGVTASADASVVDPVGGNNAYKIEYDAANKELYQRALSAPAGTLIAIWVKGTNGETINFSDGVAINNLLILDGSWQQVYIKSASAQPYNSTNTYNTATARTIWVYGATTSLVTYETTPRTGDQVITTSAAYYGPRFDYDPVTLDALGLLLEGSRTNVVLRNRDLTNAAWTATNVTPLKDQTGVDGVANSASKITATAGNGTILQAITLASSARFQSAYVKRVTGSGTIEMTMDNGTTWTPITVTADWTRVSIPTQTLANPTIGFRVVTSGDAIAVDFVQNENGAFASSPILTTAATVTRATDSISAALYTSNPAIIQYRSVETGVRARKKLAELDDIASEQNIWLEEVAVYPIGTTDAYLDAHLVVDGSY